MTLFPRRSVKIIHATNLFITTGITLLVAYCNHPSQVTEQVYVIMPLDTGNTWQYTKTFFSADGVPSDTLVATMTVVRAETLDSFPGFYVDDLIIGPPILDRVILANLVGGLYTATAQYVSPPRPPKISKALPFPTFEGDSLTYFGYGICTRAVSDPVVVPAGAFRCIKYNVISDTDTVAIIWATPNVGLVRVSYLDGFVHELYELRSFHVK